jgi:hypothetical protein
MAAHGHAGYATADANPRAAVAKAKQGLVLHEGET